MRTIELSDDKLRSALRRLAAGEHVESPKGHRFVAECWRSADRLVEVIESQWRLDPTFGFDTASASFAALALRDLGMNSIAQSIEAEVREWWTVSAAQLPVAAVELTAEGQDFVEIRKTMAEEDALTRCAWSELDADSLDFDVAHRMWVSGIMLKLFAASGNSSDVHRLTEALSAHQHESGAFYPDRIPWVTARVVIGLAATGATYQSSTSVRRACDWLTSPRPLGPSQFGVVEGGTGRWSSDVLTTALVLLALSEAQATELEIHCEAIRSGCAYLLAKRNEWFRPTREIETALVVQALVACGTPWRSLRTELRGLFHWANSVDAWSSLHAPAWNLETETCKTPFVASSAIETLMMIARRESGAISSLI